MGKRWSEWSSALGAVLAVLFSTLAEKNPLRQQATPGPLVLSAGRIVVVSLTVVWCRVVLERGFSDWPSALLGFALAFALPLTRAMEGSSSQEVLAFGKDILARFAGEPAPASPAVDEPAEEV